MSFAMCQDHSSPLMGVDWGPPGGRFMGTKALARTATSRSIDYSSTTIFEEPQLRAKRLI